ncbi:MAG: UPF0175 family protein [Anaerolineae bacterium]|jgi:predicted HTH domain antitoxin|uniref:UPF0175 family protein n=1 Tax=Thermogutta sp. TaxID=1962930 RepID=UPI00321FCFCA
MDVKVWVLPSVLREWISVVPETGLYASESEFLRDAISTLLAARPDIRLALACKLYERGDISLSKAAELSGLDIEAMKEVLYIRGISRGAPESAAETKAMAEAALKAAGR